MIHYHVMFLIMEQETKDQRSKGNIRTSKIYPYRCYYINWSEEKRWGDRVTEGGDMYEQQKSFRELIAGFTDEKVKDSINKIGCEVIELDGTLPV